MLQEMQQFIVTRKKANLTIVIINVVAFVILSFLGNTQSTAFMMAHGACYPPLIAGGEYWRLITGMFLHFGLVHLIYNMICLLSLGEVLETCMGTVRYLIIYLIGGIAGNLLSLALELRTGHYAVSAGASGAIFAVIGAMLAVAIRRRGRLGNLFLRRMLLMSALMISQGFLETATDNAAHVGGFVTGLLLGMFLYREWR